MKQSHDSAQGLPLRALRVFEAVGRLGSMAEAAEELGVSASAVSHQLAFLEAHLETTLFRRSGRGISLTQEGRGYYRPLRRAFSVIDDATSALRTKAALLETRISVIPLFATGWLIPRLENFLRLNPITQLNITYASHADYVSDVSSLSVRFGLGSWNGFQSSKIISGAVSPICSRGFLDRHGPVKTPVDLVNLPLLHDEDYTGWKLWFGQYGIQLPKPPGTGSLFEDGQLTVSATLAGLGVALIRKPMVEREIESGELICLFEGQLDDDRHYFVCERIEGALSEQEKALRDWIVSQTSCYR